MSKNLFCPNLSHPHAQEIIKSLGLRGFYRSFIENGYEIPDPSTLDLSVSNEGQSLTSFLKSNPHLTREDYNKFNDSLEKHFNNPIFVNNILRAAGYSKEYTNQEKKAILDKYSGEIVDEKRYVTATLLDGSTMDLEIVKYKNGSGVAYVRDPDTQVNTKLAGFDTSIDQYLVDNISGNYTSRSEDIKDARDRDRKRKSSILSKEAIKSVDETMIDFVKELYRQYASQKGYSKDENFSSLDYLNRPSEANAFKDFVRQTTINNEDSVEDQIYVNKDVFSAVQQASIVDTIVAKAYDQINKAREQDSNIKVSQVYENIYNIFKDTYVDATNKAQDLSISENHRVQYETIASRYKSVFDNFNKFFELASNQLASNGFDIKDRNASLERLLEKQLSFEDNVDDSGDIDSVEALYRKSDYSDEANFSISGKDTASAHLKQALSLIPVLRRDPQTGALTDKPLNGYLGLPTYESIDTIWGELLFLLNNVPIGDKLNYLSTLDNPRYKLIYNAIINNPNLKIRNEFESVFSKQYADFVTIKLSKPTKLAGTDNKGNDVIYRSRQFNVFNTNRNNADDILYDDWNEDFLLNPEFTLDESTGNYNFDYNKVANRLNTIRQNLIDIDKLNNMSDKVAKFPELFKNIEFFGVGLSGQVLNSFTKNYKNKDVARDIRKVLSSLKTVYKSFKLNPKDLSVDNINPYYQIEDNKKSVNSDTALALKTLTKIQNKLDPVIFEASFITGDGKSKYAFSNNSYLTHQFGKVFSDTDINYRNNLANTAFAKDSIYLNMIMQDPSMASNFKLAYIDSLGSDAKKGIRNKQFKAMNDTEKEMTRISLYMNNGIGANLSNTRNAGYGYFVSLINSDKTTHPVFQLPKLRTVTGFVTSELTNGQRKVTGFDISDDTYKNVIYPMYLSEYNRVRSAIQESKSGSGITPIKNYHNGLGTKFVIFESLNNIMFDSEGNLRNDPEVHNEAKANLKEFFSNMAMDTKQYWDSLGINPSEINNKNYNRNVYGHTKDMTMAEYYRFAFEYSTNQFVSMFNQMQLFSGDLALSSKGSVDAAWTQFFKRMAKDIAPGLDGNFPKGSKAKYVILKDIEKASQHIDQYLKVLPKEIAEAYGFNKDKNTGKWLDNGKMNIADAQEYTTFDEHIRVMKAYGRLNLDEKTTEAIERLRSGVEVRKEDLHLIFQPMKPVYVDMVPNGNNAEVFYIKSSSFPLIPALTIGTPLDKLRLAMENHIDSNTGQVSPIDRAVYESAMKLGIKGDLVNIVGEDGEINISEIPHTSVINLPRTGFRIQMELPNHSATGNNTESTQARKLLHINMPNDGISIVNGIEHSNSTVKETFNKLHYYGMREGFDSIKQDLGFDADGNLISPIRLAKYLKDEAISKDYSANDINSIQLVNEGGEIKFKLPLALNKSAEKFEAILNSLITNRAIKQELPGFMAVQGSSAGFKLLDVNKYNENFSSNIITYIDSNDTNLKYATVSKESGKDILMFNKGNYSINLENVTDNTNLLSQLKAELDRLTALNSNLDVHPYKVNEESLKALNLSKEQQFLIKNYIADTFSKVIEADIIVPNYLKGVNIKDYIVDGKLDTSRFPKELLQIIGIRIPTQGHNSMMRFNVKGFLEESMGEFCIVPEEIVIQMGADFDVDKLFIYRYEFTNKNGKLSKVDSRLNGILDGTADISKLTRAERNNAILDLMHAKLSEGSVIQTLLEPNGFGALPDILKDIKKLDTSLAKPVHNFTTRAQNNIHSVNNDGKVGVAVFSLFSTFNRKLQDYQNLNVEGMNLLVDGQYINTLSGMFTTTGDLKSNVIMYLQSAAVDNAKEQILGVLNINNRTINVAGTMALMGLNETYIAYILAQPVLKELVRRMSSNGDIYKLESKTESLSGLIESLVMELTEESEPSDTDNMHINLSLEELKNNISNRNPLVDRSILYTFARFSNVATQVGQYMNLLNTDSSGLGSSFASVLVKKNRLDNFGIFPGIVNQIIQNTDQLLNNSTEPSIAAIDILNDSTKMYSSIYDFYDKNVLETFRLLGSKLDINIDEDFVKNMFRSLKAYTFSNSELFGEESLYKKRYELLYSPKNNIAEKFANWSKTPEGKASLITKRIKSRKSSRKGEPNAIVTVNTKATNKASDVNKVTTYFYAMLNSKSPQTRELAEDMIKYFYLTGGSFSPTSIGKYINNDILEKYNFSSKVRNQLKAVTESLDYNKAKFLIQFFQNNPHLLNKGSLDAYKQVYDRKKQLLVTDDPSLPAIFTLYDSNRSKYILFGKQSDMGNYRELPIIDEGTGMMHYEVGNEYTFNTGNQNFFDAMDSVFKASKDYLTYDLNEVDNSIEQLDSAVATGEDKALERFDYKEGGKALDVLNRIISSNNTDPEMLKLAVDIKNNFIDLDKVTLGFTASTAGSMSSNLRMSLNVNGFAAREANGIESFDESFTRTFLHELIHGVTVYYMEPQNLMKLNDVQRRAVSTINSLYNEYKRNYSDQGKLNKFISLVDKLYNGQGLSEDESNFVESNRDELYGLYNAKEFITNGLTSSTFRNKLKQGNLWTKIINLLKRLLRLGKSDLDVLYDSVTDLMESSRPQTEFSRAGYSNKLTDHAMQNEYNNTISRLYDDYVNQKDAFSKEFNIFEGSPLTVKEAYELMDKVAKDGTYRNIQVLSVDNQAQFFERDMPTDLDIRTAVFNTYVKDTVDFDIEGAVTEAKKVSKATILDKFGKQYLISLKQMRDNLRGKLKSQKNMSGNENFMKARLNELRNEIKSLEAQVFDGTSFNYTIDIAKNKLNEIQATIDSYNKGNITIDETTLSDMIKYLNTIKSFNGILAFEYGSDSQNAIDEVSNRANVLSKKVLTLSSKLIDDYVKTNLNMDLNSIDMVRQGIRDIEALPARFLDFSNINNKYVQALGYMIQRNEFNTTLELKEFSGKFKSLIEDYYKQYNASNLDEFLQKDENGKWSGNLLSKYQAEYYTKASTDFKFRTQNTKLFALKDKWLMDREEIKNNFPDQLKRWDKQHDLKRYETMYKKGLKSKVASKAEIYFQEIPIDKWIDSKFTEIKSLPETDSKRVLFEFIASTLTPINKRYNKYGNYLADVGLSNKELIMQGNIKGAFRSMHNDIKEPFNQNDLILTKDIDVTTGDIQMQIPVRLFEGKLTPQEKTTDLARIVELVKSQDIAIKNKFEIEPLLMLYQNMIRNSDTVLDAKRSAEDEDHLTLKTPPKNLSELSLFMIQNYLYGYNRDKTSAEKTYGKAIDLGASYIRLKGMGWNPFSAIGNVMQSITSNLVFAADGRYFKGTGYLYGLGKAMKTFSNSEESNKIEALYNFFDLQPIMSEITFDKSRILNAAHPEKLGKLDPMYLTQLGELFNQSHTMISMLSEYKVTNPEGKEVPIYDAFNNDGTWNSAYGENPFNTATKEGRDKLFKFQMKMRNAIIEIHGNYVRPMLAKKNFYTRMLLVFRTWLPQAINTRFGSYSKDEFINRETEGRYRTVAKLIKDGKLIDSIRQAWGNNFSEEDAYKIANLRKTAAEMIMVSVLAGIALMVKSLVDWDDMDEEAKMALTYQLNVIGRAQNDLILFMNPATFKEMTKDPIPIASVVDDFTGVMNGVYRTITGDGTYKTGSRKGQSVLVKELIDFIPGATQIDKNISYGQNLFSDR